MAVLNLGGPALLWMLVASAAQRAGAAPNSVLQAAATSQAAVNRTLPAFRPPNLATTLSEEPTAEELRSVHWFPEPLVPAEPAPSAEHNRQLAGALKRFSGRTLRDDFSALEQFTDSFPSSSWTPSLLLNLGLEYYQTGWYSKALTAWEKGWPMVGASRDSAVKAVADRMLGELALMYARLGRMGQLSRLLDSVQGRVVPGSAGVKLAGARQGLWSMRNHPEMSFRCGPLALDRINAFRNPGKVGNQYVARSESSTNGFSLAQVAKLSASLGLNYQMAFRSQGAPLLMPAVVHWKVGHYAALLEEKGGLYLVEDPTFRNRAWVTLRALEAESSGYCLVPPGNLPAGWRSVSESEGMTVWGKGQTDESDPNSTTPYDPGTHDGCPPPGMAVFNTHLLLCNLNLRDNPVGYKPPVGPHVRFLATYNELEAGQPATFSYSNLGPKWTFNWLAYLSDDPSSPFGDVNYYTDGGGTLPFTGFDGSSFAPELKSQALLTRTGPGSYQMLFPDGFRYIFALPTATNGTSRNVFLTQIVDPQGNASQISYDSSFRVVALTDAIGQVTTLSYADPLDSLKITKVTDPFGRIASFTYDQQGRLSQITDSLGMVSQFNYDAGDNILAMTTPYGTTSFDYTPEHPYLGTGPRESSLEITYPNAEKERVEFNETLLMGIDSQDPASTVPQGIWTRDWVMYGRDTYYWDRNAYPAYAANPSDFSTAHNYHWLHSLDLFNAIGILESQKRPLENRVWYNYDGQAQNNDGATVPGNSSRPSAVAHVLDDGSTQLRRVAHNPLGHVTNVVDPVGRAGTYLYSSNLLDLLEVRQTTGTNNELLARYAYNAQHRPVTIADASGQTWSSTYNARGQLLTRTDPLGSTTTFNYDTNGHLLTVVSPLGPANDTIAYAHDAIGRVRTITGTDGYVLSFGYDNGDRLTNITYPDGTFQAFIYSNLDQVAALDRLGRQTRYTYDALRRLIAAQDPLGRVTRFEYCGCGSLAAVIDPMGRRTAWEHDIQGRLIAKAHPDGSRISYNYENTSSRLKSILDETGQYTTYDYNADDTLNGITYPNAAVPTPPVLFSYDPNYSRLAAVQDGVGTRTYAYNAISPSAALGAGRLASVSGPLPNATITYEYDALGRVAREAINGVRQATGYDTLGRRASVTNALGTFQYGYVGATKRLEWEAYPNGQSNRYAYYDNQGDRRLRQILHLKPDGTLLSGFGYAYSPANQILRWTNDFDTLPETAWSLGYDGADQLTGAVLSSAGGAVDWHDYAYDLAGNLVQEQLPSATNQFTYNALNQLLSASPGGPPIALYEWDAAQRLTSATNGGQAAQFSYDGLGRRVEIREQASGTEATNKLYVWSSNQIQEERDQFGAVIKRFFPQGFTLETGTNSGSYFYTQDHLGSVREVVDAAGNLRARYAYLPYGVRSRIAGDLESDFAFTGHLYESAAGLYLTKYRAYDPQVGRWLSRDPAADEETAPGPNLYAYVRNNPVGLTDPLGLLSHKCKLALEVIDVAMGVTAKGTESEALEGVSSLFSCIECGAGSAVSCGLCLKDLLAAEEFPTPPELSCYPSETGGSSCFEYSHGYGPLVEYECPPIPFLCSTPEAGACQGLAAAPGSDEPPPVSVQPPLTCGGG